MRGVRRRRRREPAGRHRAGPDRRRPRRAGAGGRRPPPTTSAAVARLVLSHRQRRHPLDDPGRRVGGARTALDDALASPTRRPPMARAAQPRTTQEDQVAAPSPWSPVVTLIAPRTQRAGIGGRPVASSARRRQGPHGGRPGSRTAPVERVAVVPTLQAAAARRAAATGRRRRRRRSPSSPRPTCASRSGRPAPATSSSWPSTRPGSMGMDDRMAAVKGALLGLLVDAYQRRDRVALVTFRGEGGGGGPAPDRQRGGGRVAAGDAAPPAARPRWPRASAGRRPGPPVGDRRPCARCWCWSPTGGPPAAPRRRRPDRPGGGRPDRGRRRRQPRPAGGRGRRRAAPTGPRLGLAVDLALAMGARRIPLPALTAGTLEATLRRLF